MLGGEIILVHLGFEITGTQGVDADALFRQFQCHGPGQLDHRGFGRAVAALSDTDPEAENGCHIDDGAGQGSGYRPPAYFMGHAPDAVQIGFDDKVPTGLVDLEEAPGIGHTGIVDQNIAPQCASIPSMASVTLAGSVTSMATA